MRQHSVQISLCLKHSGFSELLTTRKALFSVYDRNHVSTHSIIEEGGL